MHSQIRLSFLKIKLKELLRSSIKLKFSNQPSQKIQNLISSEMFQP